MCTFYFPAHDQVQISTIHSQQTEVQNCRVNGDRQLTSALVSIILSSAESQSNLKQNCCTQMFLENTLLL